MNAFLAGAIFGALFIGAIFTVFISRIQRPRPEPDNDWTPEFIEAPAPVFQTRALITERIPLQ